MPKYIVVHGFRSPNVSKQKGVILEFKEFKEGQEVNGSVYDQPKVEGLKFIPSLIIDGSFLIPLTNVRPKEVTTVNIEGNSDVKEGVVENIKTVITGGLADVNEKKNNGYKVGAVLGALSGFGLAYKFEKSKMIYSLIGAAIGGYVGYLIASPKKESNTITKL